VAEMKALFKVMKGKPHTAFNSHE